MITEGCKARGLPLELIAAATSGYVARRFRLPGKGRLEPGADADLALVDLTASHELSADDLHYRHRHSPFVGRSLSARVVRTLVRGQTVFANGRIVGPPAGRLLIPAIETETS
jgi:allantoinase